jgi:hypothetical protein
MRIYFCLLFVFTCIFGYSQEKADSSRSKLKFSGSVSINSNGMAQIPSFSLDKPAVIAAFILQKKRFSYDPQIAYGLNLRPWTIDNWFHYKLIYKPKFELRAGGNFAMFFSEYDTGEDKILQGQQYLTFEIACVFKFAPKSSFSLMYWSDNGQDPGSIDGSFYNMLYERADFEIGETILLSGNLQLYYLDYTGNNDGLFISPKIAASVRHIPLSLFFMGAQALTSNIEPYPAFKWNAGMAYVF